MHHHTSTLLSLLSWRTYVRPCRLVQLFRLEANISANSPNSTENYIPKKKVGFMPARRCKNIDAGLPHMMHGDPEF